MLQKNGGKKFPCVFLLLKVLQIINNRAALLLFQGINVKVHLYIPKLNMCFQMLKIVAMLSHVDIFKKTFDKNQEQKAICKLFCKKSDS